MVLFNVCWSGVPASSLGKGHDRVLPEILIVRRCLASTYNYTQYKASSQCSIQNLTSTNYHSIFLLVFGKTRHSIAIQTEIRDSKNPVRGGGGSILVVSLFQIIGSYLHDNERETGNNGDGNVL